MIIYLYVKTHNVTGLKYLGKTLRKDPHKYPGSGTRWTNHLKVHGYDYTTTILKECTSNEEVKELGLYYSELWNVVESDDWANLITESGEGGGASNPGKLNGMYGKTHSNEVKIKLAQLRRDALTGKSYKELYGEEKADRLKQDKSIKLKSYCQLTPGVREGSNNGNAKSCIIVSPAGLTTETISLKTFCKENNLSYAKMSAVARGERPNCNGWIVNYTHPV